MRLLVLVLTAVAVVVADHREHSSFLEPRLIGSAIRISRLSKEIRELEHEIKDAAKIDPLGFAKEMHARLDRVEDPVCPAHYLQCGWESFDCVSDLALCDGHNDCYNGWDESKETCSHGPIEAGNVFTGMANWRSCLPFLEHPVSMKITGVIKSKVYPARLGVTAHSVADIPHENLHVEGDLHGSYTYGSKRLILMPDKRDDGILTLTCDFNHGDDERADCHLFTEAGRHECADIHLTLTHRDTHHTTHRDTHGEDHRGEIVEHHYDIEGHDHAEHFDRQHRRIQHEDDDH